MTKSEHDDGGPCPEILPIFPLSGVLLLPGSRLPLHIFEPRYRAMLEDALAGGSFIGMVQPAQAMDAKPDSVAGDEQDWQELEDLVPEETDKPELYEVGCAGRIDRWERLPDGRYMLVLLGVQRFRTRRELPLRRGYRSVEASYEDFPHDLPEEEPALERLPLLSALEAFGQQHGLELDMDKFDSLSGLAILNSLAMALPFAPAEKQALLEAVDVEQRLHVLLSLMQMGVSMGGDDTRAGNSVPSGSVH